jgi:hypothetical protein
MFALYISLKDGKSMIQYGGYNLKKYAHPSHQYFDWHALTDARHHWSLTLDSLSYQPQNGKADPNKALGMGQKIIVDSGTSYFLMPYNDRRELVRMLNANGVRCRNGRLAYCICPKDESRWPDIKMTINGKNYFIPW